MACAAVIEQGHPAVHAKVGLRVGSRGGDRALATRAHAASHSLECLLVTKSPTALRFGLLLDLGAARDVAAHRTDYVKAGESAQDDPHPVTNVAAVARQVRHELEEEREEPEENEATEERPVLAVPLAHKEPRGDEKEWQGE